MAMVGSAPSQPYSANALYQRKSDDLWNEAVQSLSTVDKTLVDFQRNDRRAVLEEVLQAAEIKRQQCLRQRWKIKKKNGEVIILRDVFEKIIKWINTFKTIGDIVIQYDPGHASLPWAGLCLLMQLTINESQTFGAMIEGMEVITNLIARYAIFEDLYLRQAMTATARLKTSLVTLYAAILVFLGKGHHYYNKNTAARIAKSFVKFTDNTIDELMRDIKDRQADVEKEAQLVAIEILQNASQNINHLAQKADTISSQVSALSSQIMAHDTTIPTGGNTDILRQVLLDLDRPMQRMASRLSDLFDGLQREDRSKILQWISTIPYSLHHQAVRKDRLPDSGDWMLRNAQFKAWMESSSSATLWLHGIPGSGKSKLASLVIDQELGQSSQNTGLAPVAYFYCSRSNAEPQRSDPDEILRSIARQLSGTNEYLPVRERAKLKYDHLGKPMSGVRKLSLEESVELILELLEENPATIVIDALDECDPNRRHELFESLDKIVQRSTNVVKVFISSRNDGDIVCRLANSPNIYIDSTLNGEDMERFISIEVTKAIHLKRILGGHVSYALEKRIVETLSHGAQGMFRWVSLQLQNLCDPRRMKIESDILHELGHLPRTLAELYSIIYEQIVQSGPSSRLIGERALKWIMVARQPLKTQELISAVAVDDAGNRYNITKEDILNMTCNLLEEDPILDRFRFAHMSVLEYLESRADYNAEEINLLASWRCLDVVLNFEPPSTVVRHNAMLQRYSDYHALFHCSKVSQPQRIQSLSPRLNTLLPLNKIYQTQPQSAFARWRTRVNQMKFGAETELTDDLMVRGSEEPFVVVCMFGFSELLTSLVPDHVILLNRANTSRRSYNYRGMTGFEIAIRHDRHEVVAMLLEKGINISEYTSHGETPLHLACSLGQYEMIQRLLDCGADPNMMSRVSRAKNVENENSRSPSRSISALGFRSAQGGLGSALDEDAEAPIHSAAFTGKAESVRMLLRMGANVNLKSSQGCTALHKALEGGHPDIVNILLDAGADANVPLIYGRTPLHFAAALGQERSALQLVASGADSSIVDFFGQTPYDVAVRYNHDSIAEILKTPERANPSQSSPSPWLLRRWTEEDETVNVDGNPTQTGSANHNSQQVSAEWSALRSKDAKDTKDTKDTNVSYFGRMKRLPLLRKIRGSRN